MKKGVSLTNFISQNEIEQRIFLIRRHKVMVDRDLAELYGVETKNLNRQVKRNKERFPDEFMFQLNAQEKEELVTKCHRFQSMKHATVLPYVFTEYGVIMLASVLNSDRAVKMSIYIVKTFVKLREILSTNQALAQKLDQLEQKIEKHDQAIRSIFDAIRRLMVPESDYYKKTRIGFIVDA
jgi:phage regulator Rha-like protein